MTNIAKETEPKKYDKAYVVEDDMLWEVFGDGYSKAQVIWDKENICELLNNLHQENQELKAYKLYEDNKRLQTIIADLKEENKQLKGNCEIYKIPTKCDECDFLGTNGICGYCKFTLNCYDGKNDLINGKVLPNCPFTKTDKDYEKLQNKLKKLEQTINQSLEDSETNKTPMHLLKLGEDIGYWNGVNQHMKKLKKILGETDE